MHESQKVSYLACVFPPMPITSTQHSGSDDISVGTDASFLADQLHINLLQDVTYTTWGKNIINEEFISNKLYIIHIIHIHIVNNCILKKIKKKMFFLLISELIKKRMATILYICMCWNKSEIQLTLRFQWLSDKLNLSSHLHLESHLQMTPTLKWNSYQMNSHSKWTSDWNESQIDSYI